MSNRWFGGLINSVRPTVTGGKSGTATGIYTSTQALQQVSGGNFPLPKTVPGAPTIGTATATSGTTASVTFTAPADNGGSAITGYTATSSPGGITGTGSSSPITVTGLDSTTTYTFTVTATNAIGTSAPSAASNSLVLTSYMSATGGTITTDGNYKIHTFTGNGTFTITALGDGQAEAGKVQFLIIGGGGGGGGGDDSRGGGGGAGGYVETTSTTSFSVGATGNYPVTVGGGGAGSVGTGVSGTGGDSSVFSVVAKGGGRAGYGPRLGQVAGGNGGSGGGGTGYEQYRAGGSQIQTSQNSGISGIAQYGFNGGGSGAFATPAPGGGGAGGAGAVAFAGGGAGLYSSITGSSIGRAGGGHGAQGSSSPFGAGIGDTNGNSSGQAALANRGSGGGGGGSSGGAVNGGAGGSGIVIIRYRYQ